MALEKVVLEQQHQTINNGSRYLFIKIKVTGKYLTSILNFYINTFV